MVFLPTPLWGIPNAEVKGQGQGQGQGQDTVQVQGKFHGEIIKFKLWFEGELFDECVRWICSLLHSGFPGAPDGHYSPESSGEWTGTGLHRIPECSGWNARLAHTTHWKPTANLIIA